MRESVFRYPVLLIAALFLCFCGCTGTVPEEPVQVMPAAGNGVPLQMAGPHFVVYYHTGDDADAAAVLSLLERDGVPLYDRYLGTGPSGIPVYLATGQGEYRAVSGSPDTSPEPGAVSVYQGTISVYLPLHGRYSCNRDPLHDGWPWNAASSLTGPWSAARPCIYENRIIWGGAYAMLMADSGSGGNANFPYFFREGIARYVEYRFRAGPAYNPRDLLDRYNLPFPVSFEGYPVLMSSHQMEQRCTGPSGGELYAMCREESAYAAGYLERVYGQDTLPSFLTELKKRGDWRLALEQVTGRGADEVWDEMIRRRDIPERFRKYGE